MSHINKKKILIGSKRQCEVVHQIENQSVKQVNLC
jgi:hypothetical protein